MKSKTRRKKKKKKGKPPRGRVTRDQFLRVFWLFRWGKKQWSHSLFKGFKGGHVHPLVEAEGGNVGGMLGELLSRNRIPVCDGMGNRGNVRLSMSTIEMKTSSSLPPRFLIPSAHKDIWMVKKKIKN